MRAFFRDESGAGLLEYTLILALVALVVVTTLQVLGDKSGSTFDSPLPRAGSALS
jgi:Flp pilus assembly pilin Flp